jgi:hypothetical protein
MEVIGQLHFPTALSPEKVFSVDPKAGLEAVVRRKIPSIYQDSNPRSSSP